MKSILAATLILVSAGAAHASEQCSMKNLGLILAPDAAVVASRALAAATITVELMEPTDRIRVHLSSQGALAHRTRDVELTGPWAPGESVPLRLEASATGEGAGEVSVTVTTFDSNDRELRMRRTVLYGLVTGERMWLSGSSPTDLSFRRAAVERGERHLSPEAYAATLEAIVRTRVKEDREPRLPLAKTAVDREIERALGYTTPPKMVMRTAGTRTSATITAKGHAEWTDRSGAKHGIPLATVEIYDEDLLSNNLIATVSTDAVGDYTSTFTYDDGLLGGLPDIFVRVLARSAVADIKPDVVGASTYALQSPTTNNVPDGTTLTLNFTAGNVNDGETVFSLHHALTVIGAYAGSLAGTTPAQVDTHFPTTTKSTSCFANPTLHILRLDRWDWDVLHHEYGHYFMAAQGFQANPGGNHGFDDNLSSTRGSKAIGLPLAWGEGWPTFFGTSGQKVMGFVLPAAGSGDTRYTDTEDSTNDVDLEPSTGKGEDNEVSVMAALWDLFDPASDGEDVISLGDKSLFNSFKASACTTMGAAWEAVAATFDTRGKTLVGAVLGQANIAPVLLTPADNVDLKASDPPPEFKWKPNGGGTPNPLNDFRIRFYSADFSTVAFEKELGDTETFTPTAGELTQIFSQGTPIKWVVEGKNTGAPETPGGTLAHYWSGARTIGGISFVFVIDDTGSMSQEIAGVVGALQAFIDTVAAGLPAGASPPTIQLVTFKDYVVSRIISNNLNAVKAAVASLVASGGGDCPEFSAHALQYASTTVAPGGTILLATDAAPQPGVDMGAVVSNLLAKGVTINTLLSGDCTPIGGRPTLQDLPDQLLPAGEQADEIPTHAAGLVVKKPGDTDPPQPPIVVPGQPPPDDHGNTPAAATHISLDALPVRGIVGADGDTVDCFELSLPTGSPTVRVWEEDSYYYLTLTFLDSDGTTVLGYNYAVTNTVPTDSTFTVTGGGFATVFMLVTRPAGATGTAYRVSVVDDPLTPLTTAVGLFSAVSAITNGAFMVRDDVNLGKTAKFQAGLYNLLMSTIQPTALAANPDTLPQSTTLGVTLQGRKTNFRTGSTVAFSGSGITVDAVTVHSATSLTVLVTVAADAAVGLRDATVTTNLGAGIVEMATGTSVVEVGAPITTPQILSVEPATLTQGKATHVIVRGVSTAWGATSTLSLGTGISISAVTATSATRLEAEVAVASGAGIGYRTATVTTGAPTESKTRSVFVGIGGITVPLVASANPAQGARGQALNVAVTGSDSHFVDGVTTGSFGAGITVTSVTVTDATHATAHILIDPGAPVGYRDVALTTGSETAVLLNGFFVTSVAVGDLNADGSVNVADVFYLINYLFAGGPSPVGPGNVNGDGGTNVADVFYLINFLFAGGPAPV